MQASGQQTHRPGPLKQQNKTHKSRHRSHRELAVAQKGKVDIKSISRRRKDLGREQRRNQMKQLRNKKRSEVLLAKRSIGGVGAPPLSILVYSSSGNVALLPILDFFKQQENIDLDMSSFPRSLMINSQKFKTRYQFITVPDDDLYSLLDGVKTADIFMLVHSLATDVDDLKNNLFLNSVYSHFLPTTFHLVSGLADLPTKKKAEIKATIQRAISTKFHTEKLHTIDSSQDATQLLHLLANSKRTSSAYKKNRSYLFAQDREISDGKFCVTGYVRSQPLDVNRLVHLPGFGDFQIESIEVLADPFPLKSGRDIEMAESKIIRPDSMIQESLESENPLDPMEGEQTFPTADEIKAAEAERKSKKKVPKGTSDYQAAWIVDDDEDADGESDDDASDDESDIDYENENEHIIEPASGESDEEEEEDEDAMDETESEAIDEHYDEKIDMDEEEDARKKYKAARENEMFPDEVDTPNDVAARIRFARYRGLKSFNFSKWDARENLPCDYSRIFQFQNFSQTRKRVMKDRSSGVEVGSFIRVSIKNPSQELVKCYSEQQNKPLVIYSLLPHENKMSVVNVVLQRHASLDEPIRSKERLIFHLGCRRFAVRPIFSAHTNGDKFKYEKFLRTDEATVATFYAPITYPPASVVVFKELADGSKKLVATGSLLNVNPDRMVIKRVVLSGHPFKINKRLAVVRYMFFNKDDILWFKPVELRSKYGRKGHIKEPLGTHGHMKCTFDRQLSSMDTVLMNLYKRVFPKWNYDDQIGE